MIKKAQLKKAMEASATYATCVCAICRRRVEILASGRLRIHRANKGNNASCVGSGNYVGAWRGEADEQYGCLDDGIPLSHLIRQACESRHLNKPPMSRRKKT
jgi:hypothetical protein